MPTSNDSSHRELMSRFHRVESKLSSADIFNRRIEDLSGCIRVCNEVLSAVPDDSEAYRIRAELRLRQAKLEKAAADIHRSIELRRTAKALVTRSKIFLATGSPLIQTTPAFRPTRRIPNEVATANALPEKDTGSVMQDLKEARNLGAKVDDKIMEISLAKFEGFSDELRRAYSNHGDHTAWTELAQKKFNAADNYSHRTKRRKTSKWGGGIEGNIPLTREQSRFLFRSARRDLGYALSISADSFPAQFLLARCNEKLGYHDDAIIAYQTLISATEDPKQKDMASKRLNDLLHLRASMKAVMQGETGLYTEEDLRKQESDQREMDRFDRNFRKQHGRF